jgi:hypothetical protein
MGMPKRITQSRWVISRKDPSLSYFTNSQLKDYWMTLDIEKLEPLEKALDAPVQFKIAPLEVRFEWMDEGPKTNWWNVFQTHVREIRGLDWKPVWSKPEGESVECLDDAERENFPLDFVQDVSLSCRRLDFCKISGDSACTVRAGRRLHLWWGMWIPVPEMG